VPSFFGACDSGHGEPTPACCSFGNPALLGEELVYRKSFPHWFIREKRGPIQVEVEVRQLGKSFSSVLVEFVNGPTFFPKKTPEEYARWVASQFHEALGDADAERKATLTGLAGSSEAQDRTTIESCLLLELPLVRIKARFLLETKGFPSEDAVTVFYSWLDAVREAAGKRLDHKARRLCETEPFAPSKNKRGWFPWG